jgi:hypothetical protein
MTGKINTTLRHLNAYAKVMAFKAVGKAQRKALERAEKPAPGLTAQARADGYRKQNGTNKLTPRQQRRLAQKHHRDVGRRVDG